MAVIAKDTPTLMRCLNSTSEKLGHVKEHVSRLLEYVQSSDFDVERGVDLLQLKNHMLLSYLIDLSHVILIKSQASCDLLGHKVVDRLVEIRTVLEKIRPLEHRFSYQLDKLLRTASTGLTGGEHPLQFKPVPGNLVSKVVGEDEEGESCGEGHSEEKSGKYVPPRVVAVPYNDKKSVVPPLPVSLSEQSKLIHELRDELTEFPAEVNTFNNFRKNRKISEDKMKKNYEEEYMVRLTNRKRSHDLGGAGREELDQLTDFSLLQGLTRQGVPITSKKKRKTKNGATKKKKIKRNL